MSSIVSGHSLTCQVGPTPSACPAVGHRVASLHGHRPAPGRTETGSLADTVLVSNRGPLAFHLEDGRPVAAVRRGRAGRVAPPAWWWAPGPPGWPAPWARRTGPRPPPGLMSRRRPDASSWSTPIPTSTAWPTTWSPTPPCGSATTTSSTPPAGPGPTTGGRRPGTPTVNSTSCSPARWPRWHPKAGRVLVQDYHLALMGSTLARLRPDLKHGALHPHPVRRPIGAADAADRGGAPSCCRPWPISAPADSTRSGGRAPTDRGWPSSMGTARPRCLGHHLRVPAVRGRRPAAAPRPPSRQWPRRWPGWRIGSVGPIARSSCGWTGWSCRRTCSGGSGPSRSSSSASRSGVDGWCSSPWPIRPARACPSISAYQNEVESTVARINARWATPGWTPIILEVEDDYPRSLAALSRYDVLLVNPVRDGLNLVAKEGPLINTPARCPRPVPRGRSVRRARHRRPRDQPVRRVGDRGGAGPGAGHGRGRKSGMGRRAGVPDPRPAAGRLARRPAPCGHLSSPPADEAHRTDPVTVR